MFETNQASGAPANSQPSNNQLPQNQPPIAKPKKLNKNQILTMVAGLVIIVTAVLVLAGSSASGMLSFFSPKKSADAIAKASVDYLNKSVLQQGQVATLVSDSMVSGVVKLTIKIGTSSYDSYATTDGKLLFPEAFTMTAAAPATAPTTNTTQPTGQITPANVAKVANTMLTAYVVADCPYGLQMQRAMAAAIQQIPALANYITVRYIGSANGNSITSMHDSGPNGSEAQENLKQVCLRQEQPAVYWNYVSCYMQKATGQLPNTMPTGDSTGCNVTAKVDTAKLNACISDPSRGLAYIKADYALDTKYNVTGSPTLVLNGTTIDETPFGGRSPGGIESIICDSSTNPPSFCSTKLTTTPAATSFSLTYAGTAAAASTAANCAPAN